jgi:signal transduction histidine kinase
MSEREASESRLGQRVARTWLRVAHAFIPHAQRIDPDVYRRARTAVYSCLVPFPMSLAFAWSYWRTCSGETAASATALVLGTNVAAAAALSTLRRTGNVARATNLLLGYAFFELAALAVLFGGPFSSSIYWSVILPLVAMLTGGPRLAGPWLALCLVEYATVYGLQLRGIEFVNRLPPDRRMPLWVSSISSISLLCLVFVLIYERAKNETLRTLLGAHTALERARDAAEAANRSKSDFLANVSHEIRTPLTAILGYAELLLREGDSGAIPKSYSGTLLTIRRNGEHLLEIINDILDFSKIAAGTFDVERQPVGPVALVSDVVALMSIRAEAKGLSLAVECEPPLPEKFETDPRRLRQVLVNLIGNALKFTDHGRVVLRVTGRVDADRGLRLRFEISDTGIGISEEQMARLFQPFAQADASTARRYGGTGLGLSICKHLVELLDGEIGAQSRPGEGSTFWVELPAEPLEVSGDA